MKRLFCVPFVLIGTTVTAFSANAATLGSISVVGDSISAGYQNGTLLDCQQPHGYASLVVNQAVASGFAPTQSLVLPLINGGLSEPGVVVPCPPGTLCPSRVDPYQQATNLAVPGQNVIQAVTTRPA